MDAEGKKIVEAIVSKSVGLDSIWLIGSRANNMANERSDWDFIAFGSSGLYDSMHFTEELHTEDVDLLVVSDGDSFKNAWGAKDKRGSLSSWNWTPLSETSAQYTGCKWVANEEQAKFLEPRLNAVRVWP